MPRKTVDKPIYQMKISLMYAQPLIWRRVEVPKSVTLEDLHTVIQIAFGWEFSHLWEFQIKKETYTVSPYEDPMFETESLDAGEYIIGDLIAKTGSKFHYLYDFGDSWEHAIVLEKQLPVEPGAVYPRCVDGERAGPPEDSGGIDRYDYILQERKHHPKKDIVQEFLEWAGEDFDPARLDLKQINETLSGLQREKPRK